MDPDALVKLDTTALKRVANLAAQRNVLESDLESAVADARRLNRSWAEIGTMLGVSKQAAQRKYASRIKAA